MSDILKDYFYTGISFSSFYIDEGVFLCMKYEHSKLFINKIKYLIKLRKYLRKQKETDPCLKGNETYLVYQNINSLKESSILFSNDKSHIKLYRKMKKDRKASVEKKFDLDNLTVENFDAPITMVLKSKESESKYKELIGRAKEVRFVYLDTIIEETNRDIMFDAIKVKLLQDETDLYFIEPGMYANYIANCAFGLNKIAIIYVID